MENIKQGSTDWHELRKKGIGASESAAIMGACPYRTAYQLWLIKTGKEEESKETNFAMHKGNAIESRARAFYESLTDNDFPPTLAEHQDYPFIRASLDGYNEKENVVLEIKYQGKDNHAAAKNGIIREHHKVQLAHQLIVTNAKRADYLSYDGSTGHIVQYFPDIEYSKILFKELLNFWALVQTEVPPSFTDRDYKKIQNPKLNSLITAWKRIKKKADYASEVEERLRKSIIELCDHPRLTGRGVKIQKISRKGSVDYGAIPELKKIDLEPYRKKASESWRLEIDK